MEKKSENISIRSSRIQDAKQLALWWSSGEIMAHAGYPNGIKTDIPSLKKSIKTSLESASPKSEILIISFDDLAIGEMNYRSIKTDIFEIGIKICDFSYQKKGIGSISVKLLLKYLFNERHALKVVLDTNLNNVGAQRFYERIGFKKMSVNVDSWTDQLGKLQSSVDYEMTKEHYATLFKE